MTEQESKDLKMEIQHIFDSGANEMRIFNMIEMFLDRRDKAINYTHSCTELCDKEVLTFEEWLSNFEKTEDNNYWLNKEVLYCKEAMLLHYNDLPDE